MKSQKIGDKLTYKIKSDNPISVYELTKSLNSLADEIKSSTPIHNTDVMISEVRKGSYEFDFIQMIAAPLLPIFMEANHTEEVIKHFLSLKEFFGKEESKDESTNISIDNAQNFQNIIKPITNNTFNNCTIVIGTDVNKSLTINSNEAEVIQRKTEKFISDKKNDKKIISEELINNFEDRLIRFVQTRADNKDKGNKSVCEYISTDEIITKFANEEIKQIILDSPYHYGFVVDLEVQYNNKIPKLYKVLEIKEKIDLSE